MNLKNEIEKLSSFSHVLANESEKIIMKHFRKKLHTEQKLDKSPVTIADKESEEVIRNLIIKNYPNHGIIGEEYDDVNCDSEFTWVIDPIDGTRSYIAGHKDFGTLIALLHNQKPIVGIVNCPAHNERWFGVKDQNTTSNKSITFTSKKTKLNDSYLFTSGLYFDDEIFREYCNKIINKSKYYRLGGDCYMYGMLASGLIDIVIEDTLKPWDYMALVPVIEGAGGVISDKNNNKISLQSEGSLIATANGKLHKEVIEIIKGN